MRTTAFHFDNTIGGFVSSADANNPWLVLDRTAQERDENVKDADSNQFWLAWEADDKGNLITDMTKLKRVVWKAVQYEGETVPQKRWVMISDDAQEWDVKTRKFITKKKA